MDPFFNHILVVSCLNCNKISWLVDPTLRVDINESYQEGRLLFCEYCLNRAGIFQDFSSLSCPPLFVLFEEDFISRFIPFVQNKIHKVLFIKFFLTAVFFIFDFGTSP